MDNKDLSSVIESILLIAEKPVSTKEIASVTGASSSEIQKSAESLIESYKNRGIRIIKKDDLLHIVSAPENSEYIAKFLNEELRHDLTQAALETLAIITYKQPITRMEVEEIRGANSDTIVRNLMIRGLISEVGRKDALGRPILYGTTLEFLQFFGLENENQLPNVDDIIAPHSEGQNKELIIVENAVE